MMKKIYLGANALLTCLTVSAQTIDFESTILTTNSYNNGSDLSGGFTFQGVHFSNYYDTTYFYNTGFSISNVIDNTSPGYGNQYSAITGAGFNSQNYAIYYPTGPIDLTSNSRVLQSLKITNTTFAALSMRDGDIVGKKFGSPYNASGILDGTNGEDFFRIKIHSLNIGGDTIASLVYYLADFRFADSLQDFILDDWHTVDLTSLNVPGETIAYLVFDFESSDVGSFGINTPTYFAMDDFIFENGQAEIAENLKNTSWSIYPNPAHDILRIHGITGEMRITNLAGEIVLNSNDFTHGINLDILSRGMYLLSIQNENGIFTKSIIKD